MGAIEFHHTLAQANSLTELTVSVSLAPICSSPQRNSFTVESVTTTRQLCSTKRAELIHTMTMQLLKALVADEVRTWKSHRLVQHEGLKTNRTLVTLFGICCLRFQSAEVKCSLPALGERGPKGRKSSYLFSRLAAPVAVEGFRGPVYAESQRVACITHPFHRQQVLRVRCGTMATPINPNHNVCRGTAIERRRVHM